MPYRAKRIRRGVLCTVPTQKTDSAWSARFDGLRARYGVRQMIRLVQSIFQQVGIRSITITLTVLNTCWLWITVRSVIFQSQLIVTQTRWLYGCTLNVALYSSIPAPICITRGRTGVTICAVRPPITRFPFAELAPVGCQAHLTGRIRQTQH